MIKTRLSEQQKKEKGIYSVLGEKWKVSLAVCFVLTFLVMLFCTRSSFLYPYNNWDDANSYFSVGKGLMNGRVPYRDIFDQKGILLYFLYGLAYLVSHTTFAGVFVLEVISGTALALALFAILRRELSDYTSYPVLLVVMAAICSSVSFYWGGSAEELMLPFLAWGLYLLIVYLEDAKERQMPYLVVFLAGLFAGAVANIKFNSLGFYFIWMAILFFVELFCKRVKSAFLDCIVFLGGMFLTFLPWVIYFAMHHALDSWYEGYIYYNVFVYSDLGEQAVSLYDRVYTMAKIFYYLPQLNPFYFILIFVGFVGILFSRGMKLLTKLSIYLLFGFLFLGIYVGGVELRYYSLPLAIFAVFGGSVAGRGIEWILAKWRGKAGCVVTAIVSVVLSGAIIYSSSLNIPYLSYDKEDVFISEFSEIILQEDSPSLLNVSCFDMGLYTACDIIPNCRWFQTQTLPIDDVLIEQDRYIEEGLIDFVAARDYPPASLEGRYELIATYHQLMPDSEHDYYLYRKITSN